MPDGWMPGVEHLPNPAHGYASLPDGSMRPIAIVNHIMQGFKRTIDREVRAGIAELSEHFSIDRDGNITQYVDIFSGAYHAGRLDPGAPPTWPRYRPNTNPNLYTVGIEHEGFAVQPLSYKADYVYTEQRPWPEPMVLATIRVQRWIFDTLGAAGMPQEPSHLTVIGHNEIAPISRFSDPGPLWPRDRIITALKPQAVVSPMPSFTELVYIRALAQFLGWEKFDCQPVPCAREARTYHLTFEAPDPPDQQHADLERQYLQALGFQFHYTRMRVSPLEGRRGYELDIT